MAKRRDDVDVLFVEVDPDLKARLAALAKANHRSLTGETKIAIEKHLKSEEKRLKEGDQ